MASHKTQQELSATPERARGSSQSHGIPGPDEHHATDGFLIPDLDPAQEAPPAYGELRDQMHFSQPGFEAGAAITDTGRVAININTKNRRLADLLAPAIDSQVSQSSLPPLPPAYIPPSLGGQPGQAPPPRLNVVIQIVGSRGDVQPFVALGKVLKETYGHRVRVATHPTFQSFVEDNHLDFFSIGGDPAELMAFMVRHPGLTPGFDAIKSGEVTKRRKGISDMLVGCWRSCIESGNGLGPPPRPEREAPIDEELLRRLPTDDGREPFVADAIIANPPSFAHIHIAEKLGIPLHMMFTMPWTPTRAFPHPLADINSSNADEVLTKYLSYTLVEMMTWQGLGDIINNFREKALDLAPLSMIWAPGLLNRLKVPYTYCWSPALIPKPNDWGRHIEISGFYFLDLATSYTPEPDLAAFLDAGPPPVYIGFGSIVVDDPNALTDMIFEAVRQTGVRALVSKGWGGLGANEVGIPDGVFMLGNVPHDWLFQRVSCVVHHGGAGTTAAGIKAGKPTLVVPFFGDQPFWGAMVARAKAGPDPITYKDLTATKLANAIKVCIDPETVQQAKEYGEKIREEKGTDVGGQSFHSHLDISAMRCSLAPSRAAVWRLRRSEVRLSALAAATLVDKGIVSYSDLKLHRSKEYNTDAQPPDPISAAACSLVTDISGIGMAIADMPREMFKRSKSASKNVNHAEEPGSSAVQETAATESPAQNVSDAGSKEKAIDSNEDRGGSVDASTNKTPESSAQMRMETQPNRSSSPGGVNLEAAVGAGKNVGKIVSTGVKSPMNFCLGLAKGFRNVPTLYNDETVRPIEKVTGIGSGIKVAGREFGYGLFDGISGLVTQPLKGAEKDGAGGLVKGFGKGIGGLVTKPAAGFWGIPAYTMQGVHAEITKMFSRSSQNYIVTSRIIQGQRDLLAAAPEERNDIVARWNGETLDLEGFRTMKKKERAAQKAPASSHRSQEQISGDAQPTRTNSGWLSRLSSNDVIAQLASRGDRWLQNNSSLTSPASQSSQSKAAEDSEYEQAIQASVKQTSKGNAEEDAAVEAAIRQSVNAVRRQGTLPEPVQARGGLDKKNFSIFEDGEYQINDEEYQALIEQALQESLKTHPHDDAFGEHNLTQHAGLTKQNNHAPHATTLGLHSENDDDLRRVIEESKGPTAPRLKFAGEDDEFKQAMEASRQEALDREKNQRAEEDIMLDYVKRQSLAEAEYARQRNKGQDRTPSSVGVSGIPEDDDDEDLKRALEESLKMSHSGGAGPS